MVGNFFDALGVEENRQILEIRDRLAEMLKEWTLHYPLLRPARVPMIALSTALAFATVVLPLSPVDYLPLSKLTFWVFGVDDITDERLVTLADIRDKAKEWCALAKNRSSNKQGVYNSDQLTTLLLEIRDELSKYDLFESLGGHWTSSLQDVLDGIVREYEYGQAYMAQGADALPPLDEYLYYGQRSSGTLLWSLTAVIILGDPSVLENFESIDVAIQSAGTALRLYNDLKSFDKERQEGNINSVVILYHTLRDKEPDAAEARILAEAKQCVTHLANFYARKCFELTQHIHTDTGQIEKILVRIVDFHAYFYREYDYQTTSLAEINAMFGAGARVA